MKNTNIIKHDTPENWARAKNFVPKDGEIIIYDIYTNNGVTHELKMGDGITNVNDLKFLLLNKTNAFYQDGTLIL